MTVAEQTERERTLEDVRAELELAREQERDCFEDYCNSGVVGEQAAEAWESWRSACSETESLERAERSAFDAWMKAGGRTS